MMETISSRFKQIASGHRPRHDSHSDVNFGIFYAQSLGSTQHALALILETFGSYGVRAHRYLSLKQDWSELATQAAAASGHRPGSSICKGLQ
jgi:hypothetical protein